MHYFVIRKGRQGRLGIAVGDWIFGKACVKMKKGRKSVIRLDTVATCGRC